MDELGPQPPSHSSYFSDKRFPQRGRRASPGPHSGPAVPLGTCGVSGLAYRIRRMGKSDEATILPAQTSALAWTARWEWGGGVPTPAVPAGLAVTKAGDERLFSSLPCP